MLLLLWRWWRVLLTGWQMVTLIQSDVVPNLARIARFESEYLRQVRPTPYHRQTPLPPVHNRPPQVNRLTYCLLVGLL